MGWSDYIKRVDRTIQDETRAGILVGYPLALSDSSAAACAVHDWAVAIGGVELWVVDDLAGLAPRQPIFLGVCIIQAFGLDGDHRAGITLAAYHEAAAAARQRIEALAPEFAREDLWFDSEAPCRIYTAARGARQDQAPGGVLGVALFKTDYESSKDPPLLTPALLAGQDDKLSAAGLLAEARLFVLPHYD